MRTFIHDPDCDVPEAVQRRSFDFNTQARESIALRNAAEHFGDLAKARTHDERAETLLADAMALIAEWEG